MIHFPQLQLHWITRGFSDSFFFLFWQHVMGKSGNSVHDYDILWCFYNHLWLAYSIFHLFIGFRQSYRWRLTTWNHQPVEEMLQTFQRLDTWSCHPRASHITWLRCTGRRPGTFRSRFPGITGIWSDHYPILSRSSYLWKGRLPLLSKRKLYLSFSEVMIRSSSFAHFDAFCNILSVYLYNSSSNLSIFGLMFSAMTSLAGPSCRGFQAWYCLGSSRASRWSLWRLAIACGRSCSLNFWKDVFIWLAGYPQKWMVEDAWGCTKFTTCPAFESKSLILAFRI